MKVRFYWVKFDTDKNPDKDGNYPKMAEGDGEISLKEDETLQIEEQDSIGVTTDFTTSHETKIKEHSQSESKIEETNVFRQLKLLSFSCLMLFLIVWIVKRSFHSK